MSFWTWLLLTLVLAVIVHVLFVQAFPYIIMFVVGRVVKSPANQMLHMPPTTSDSRSVVRPSPDLLYSAVKYNVWKRPLRITAPLPGGYWSISFFANNTDNFFVANDKVIQGGEADFVLIGKGRRRPSLPGAKIVEAQSNKGVVLLRTLVMDQSRIDELVANQKRATAELI
jgi:uncharacterized membrane protein